MTTSTATMTTATNPTGMATAKAGSVRGTAVKTAAAKAASGVTVVATTIEVVATIIAAVVASANQDRIAIVGAITSVVVTIVRAITAVAHADANIGSTRSHRAATQEQRCRHTANTSQSHKVFHKVKGKSRIVQFSILKSACFSNCCFSSLDNSVNNTRMV